MLRKLLLILLCFTTLVGCRIKVDDLDDNMKSFLAEIESSSAVDGTNMGKSYYSYYKPINVGKVKSNELSEIFQQDGYRFIINFDVSHIIIEEYYKEETSNSVSIRLDDSLETSVYTGVYQNVIQANVPYEIMISQLEDNKYFIHVNASICNAYAVVPLSKIETITRTMFQIMGSTKFKKEEILANFSLKSALDTSKQNLDFSNAQQPSSGVLEELAKDPNQSGSDSTEITPNDQDTNSDINAFPVTPEE